MSDIARAMWGRLQKSLEAERLFKERGEEIEARVRWELHNQPLRHENLLKKTPEQIEQQVVAMARGRMDSDKQLGVYASDNRWHADIATMLGVARLVEQNDEIISLLTRLVAEVNDDNS